MTDEHKLLRAGCEAAQTFCGVIDGIKFFPAEDDGFWCSSEDEAAIRSQVQILAPLLTAALEGSSSNIETLDWDNYDPATASFTGK